ncbi:uncharacterized protein RB166_015345 [Leptodactylus fuscus]
MTESVQDFILSLLQELEKDSFKRFKTYLRDEEFLGSHNYSAVPRRHLEDKDYMDVAECLISQYTSEGALNVVEIVLEKINQKQLAQSLRDFSTTNCTNITNVVKILGKHLKRLSQANLENFIVALCKSEAPRGYEQIQKEHLEGKNPLKVAETILKTYTIKYGPAKVKQVLKKINENQIRVDLEKELRGSKKKVSIGNKDITNVNVKKAPNVTEAAPQMCGQIGEDGQNVEAEESSKPTETTQSMGDALGCKSEKSQQSGEDTKPKRQRRSKTETKTTEKPNVKEQTLDGAVDHKPTTEKEGDKIVQPEMGGKKKKQERKQPSYITKVNVKKAPNVTEAGLVSGGHEETEDWSQSTSAEDLCLVLQDGGNILLAKFLEKLSATPQMCGQIGEDGQNVEAEESSKPTETTQSMGDALGCKSEKSQQSGEDIKPKRQRKPKTETKTTEKSTVKEQTLDGAVDHKPTTEKEGDKIVQPEMGSNKKKQERKQPSCK